ncbi:MAG: 3-phosphoserine/phosphohydroxythreonine transaminase [Pseudomonadota bacterium]
MSTKRVYNFHPGPAAMPLEVLEKFKNSFMDFEGMSIFEISHRSQKFISILNETRKLFKDLLNIPDNYYILFLQGGAALQFSMVPLNLMDKTADYIVTGNWSKQALADANIVGEPNVAFSSEKTNFDHVPFPDQIKLSLDSSYVHLTSNNTIYGTQYQHFPETQTLPLIADMSSDILSKPIDVSKFGLIYAGAQKNVGPAGATIVIIRDDLVKTSYRNLPGYLRYDNHVKNESLYNTPPVGAIYLILLNLEWLQKNGGLKNMAKINEQKAKMLYAVIDETDFYQGTAQKESRSFMNVTFTLPSTELTEEFIAKAKEHNIVGLKGHRSVGGIRASIYNAVTLEAVEALTKFMRKFREGK